MPDKETELTHAMNFIANMPKGENASAPAAVPENDELGYAEDSRPLAEALAAAAGESWDSLSPEKHDYYRNMADAAMAYFNRPVLPYLPEASAPKYRAKAFGYSFLPGEGEDTAEAAASSFFARNKGLRKCTVYNGDKVYAAFYRRKGGVVSQDFRG